MVLAGLLFSSVFCAFQLQSVMVLLWFFSSCLFVCLFFWTVTWSLPQFCEVTFFFFLFPSFGEEAKRWFPCSAYFPPASPPCCCGLAFSTFSLSNTVFWSKLLSFFMSTWVYYIRLRPCWALVNTWILLCCKKQRHSSCFLYLLLLLFQVPLSTPGGVLFLKQNKKSPTFSA